MQDRELGFKVRGASAPLSCRQLDLPGQAQGTSSSMAVRGCSRRCRGFWFVFSVLILLLNVAAVRSAVAGEAADQQVGANCGSIDACRAGVANDGCCRAINAAIAQGTCSCACRQLSVYNHPNLAAACSQKSGCPMCRDCKCSSSRASLDERPPPYISDV